MKTILFTLAFLLAVATAQDQSYSVTSFINDNYVLNYALTLENFEAELYRRAAAAFDRNAYTNAGYNSSVYDYVQTLASQENTHATTLNTTLIQRGWPPVQPCIYKFPDGLFTSVNSFLQFTATIEQVGVSAYDGAVPYISDPAILQFAATVATVEGRHSASLNQIVGTPFSPGALEPTRSPSDVVTNSVAQYLGNCPSTVLQTGYNGTVTANSTVLPLPQFANATRQLNSTFATPNAPFVNISAVAKLNDDRVLNYALTALQFVDTFLNTALSNNPDTGYIAPVNASSLQAAGYDPNSINGLLTVLDQNTVQVAAVRMMITSRGQNPLPVCTYNFTSVVTSVAAFWPLAVQFETISVQAFDGGIRAITDTSLSLAAAAIATIEGRHSAFLNNASRLSSPFPSVEDGTLTPTQTRQALAAYIVSCPSTIEIGSGDYIDSTNFTLPSYLNYFGQEAQTIPNEAAQGQITINPASTTINNSTTNDGGDNNSNGGGGSGNTGISSTLAISASLMVLVALII